LGYQKFLKKIKKKVDDLREIYTFPRVPHGVGSQALSWISTKSNIASSNYPRGD